MWKTTPLLLTTVACLPEPLDAPVPECRGTHREVAEAEVIGTGFSAEPILALATGTFESSEEWRLDNADGRGVLRVEVSHAGGRVLACEDIPTLATPTGTGVEPYPVTVDRLDVEVEVILSTDDGLLHEESAATFLSTSTADWARAVYTLDAAALNGSLELEDAEQLQVETSFGGAPGVITGHIDLMPHGTTFLGWPAGSPEMRP